MMKGGKMGHKERMGFLKILDSAVWVEKRLFPARILVLDEIESNHKSEEFVIKMINSFRTKNKDDKYLNKNLETVALMVKKDLKSSPDNSILEQFLSDLDTYGLREALAYVFEYPDYDVSNDFEKFMINGYREIGQNFLKHSKRIKQRLEETCKKFDGKPLANIIDRLIISDKISLGDVWRDGQEQINLAIRKEKK